MTPEDTPPQPPAPTAAPARPAWLPPHIPFNGDWDTFIKALHIIFERDFVRVWPRFRALPVWHDNRKMDPDDKYNFEEGFWHLVTEISGFTTARSAAKRRSVSWIQSALSGYRGPDQLLITTPLPMSRSGILTRRRRREKSFALTFG